MSFLSGIAIKLLEWIVEKGMAIIIPLVRLFMKNRSDHSKNEDVKNALKNAKTEDELKDAARKTISDF